MTQLKVKTRSALGRGNRGLRKKNIIPAILYGHEIKNQNLEINYSDFEKVYREAGTSSLVDLLIDDAKPVKVIINEVQVSPLKNKYLHIDFHQVRMDEKIHTEIPLKFIGESRAVKELAGVLIKNFDKLDIECLPNDLIHEVEVDLSGLNDFNDAITIADLKISDKVSVLHNPKEVVVTVSTQKVEEEEVKPAEPVGEIPLAGETKKEGEEEIEEKKTEDKKRDNK